MSKITSFVRPTAQKSWLEISKVGYPIKKTYRRAWNSNAVTFTNRKDGSSSFPELWKRHKMWPNFVTVALVDFLLCQSTEEKNRYTCGHKKCTIAFLWTVYFWRKEQIPIWSQKLHCLLKFPKTIKSVQIIWYYNLLLLSSNIIKAEHPVIFHNNNYCDQQEYSVRHL